MTLYLVCVYLSIDNVNMGVAQLNYDIDYDAMSKMFIKENSQKRSAKK